MYRVIERLDPPTRISPNNTKITEENYRKCLEADNAINQRLRQYELDEVRKEKEAQEKQYWDTHPDEKRSYAELKDKYEAQSKLANDAQKRKTEADTLVMEYQRQISDLQGKIDKTNDQIAALRKKIFGKAKAQETITRLQTEVDEYQAGIAAAKEILAAAQAEKDNADEQYREIEQKMQHAKRACEDFLKERGLI